VTVSANVFRMTPSGGFTRKPEREGSSLVDVRQLHRLITVKDIEKQPASQDLPRTRRVAFASPPRRRSAKTVSTATKA